jgi:hypothetical protein
MEIHGYTETGFIDATINGVRLVVPDDMANRHRQMIAEWEAQGNTIPPYLPHEEYKSPTPSLCCVATLDFQDFEIDGVQNGAGMSMAFMIDTGKMWVFFEEPMPNSKYPWNVSSSVGKANVTDRTEEYIEITVTGEAGAPITTASVSLQIFKVN